MTSAAISCHSFTMATFSLLGNFFLLIGRGHWDLTLCGLVGLLVYACLPTFVTSKKMMVINLLLMDLSKQLLHLAVSFMKRCGEKQLGNNFCF